MLSKQLMFIVLALLGLFLSACSDALLKRPREKATSVSSAGTFCTHAPDLSRRFTKFLFVIDKSGSNQSTDRNNQYRADNIENFYNKHQDNEFIKWGYIAFVGGNATAFINDGNEEPIFSQDPNDMRDAIAEQRGGDGGNTPYKAALGMARTAIQKDLRDHPEEDSLYMVFFMSDGGPTDFNKGNPEIGQELVEDIIDVAPGRVNVSTAYYGPRDSAAARLLEKMAETGKGKFIDTNATGDFDFEDLFVGGIISEPWQIKSGLLMVYNANSALCLNNYYGADSDGDGLCDVDEVTLTNMGRGPFDPQNRFSFGDGYSDFVHYRSSLGEAPADLRPCDIRSDDDNDLLSKCDEAYLRNDNPTGTEMRSGDPLNPDTDGDAFIDGIEYFATWDRSTPMNRDNVSQVPPLSPISVGELIMQHRNPRLYQKDLRPEEYYDTRIEFTHFSNKGQACYRFDQKYLPLYDTLPVTSDKTLGFNYAHGAGENVILVYFIQTLERDPNSPGIYMNSNQILQAKKGAGGLVINSRVFRPYHVPGAQN